MTEQECLLICFIEECGEAIQAATKMLRFGTHEYYPGTTISNVDQLNKEVDDVFALVDMLTDRGVLGSRDSSAIVAKVMKVEDFMRVSSILGIVDPHECNNPDCLRCNT